MGWQGQQQQQNSNTVTYNGPVGGMTEQRPRGLSDVDTIPRTGAGMAGMIAPIAQQQQQANKAMACRPPQAAGIIGSGMGMRGGSSAITASLGWSGAGDDEADDIIGMRGLGLGGSGLGSETIGGAGSASLLHEDQSAEVERARQQVLIRMPFFHACPSPSSYSTEMHPSKISRPLEPLNYFFSKSSPYCVKVIFLKLLTEMHSYK